MQGSRDATGGRTQYEQKSSPHEDYSYIPFKSMRLRESLVRISRDIRSAVLDFQNLSAFMARYGLSTKVREVTECGWGVVPKLWVMISFSCFGDRQDEF